MPESARQHFEATIAPQLTALYRAAYRLTGNRPDAEDLVQDVCIQACENLPALEAATHADRWLLRVLYNRFVDRLRRDKRSPVSSGNGSIDLQLYASADPGPEDAAGQSEREQAIDCAWKRLESTQRALLSLRAEGYGLAEIEEITGIGRDVLRARLHRARRRLARYLDEPEVLHDDAPIIGRG